MIIVNVVIIIINKSCWLCKIPSLSFSPSFYLPLLLAGSLDCIQCPHRVAYISLYKKANAVEYIYI